jgi:hypothetical protein
VAELTPGCAVAVGGDVSHETDVEAHVRTSPSPARPHWRAPGSAYA